MKTKKHYYPGLNVYRAIAVLMMILAHAARIQTNMASLHANPAQAGVFDWPFVAMLLVEPIISAMFLFIAGFSLVLSFSAKKHDKQQWLKQISTKMGWLYAISVLFYLADRGFQLPDLLISSGVLGIIAVGVLSSGLALISPRPWQLLGALATASIAGAYFLEQERLDIVGLNAGAGGMVPLLAMAYLGTLTGLVWQRWQNNGLMIVLTISSVIAILALMDNHPWTTQPISHITQYPGDRISAVGYSLLDYFGLYEGQSVAATVRYWNHSWIFALRILPLLVLGLIISLSNLPTIHSSWQRFVDWMGTQALNLYILHLMLLALIEVCGQKPSQGWQTLLILIVIIALSSWLLKYLSFVPLRINLGKAHPQAKRK